MTTIAIFPALALALSFCAQAADGGSLKGTVKYDGDVPELGTKLIPDEKKAECKCEGKGVPDESLNVDKATKGIKWAVIRIMDSKATDKAPAGKTVELTQKGCTFTPHVVITPPETDLTILNPEKISHNIHTTPYDSEDPPQNFASAKDETYKAKWLKDPDLIEIKCDIHPWMKGFIVCHDPRYCAISAADGSFEIKDVPAGKYKVNIWQESFGNYMKKEAIDVEIKAGAATDLGELKFQPKKK